MEKRYFDRISQAKLDRIYHIIDTEIIRNEAYLKQGLTAQKLAQRYGISAKDISAVISVYYGGNFAGLLQRLRVSRVCRMLSNRENERMSCEAIGLRCGFSSRQSMYNAFRRQRQITPEEYRKKNLYNNEKNTNADGSSNDVQSH